jgi:parallel beta-helix repeat protein
MARKAMDNLFRRVLRVGFVIVGLVPLLANAADRAPASEQKPTAEYYVSPAGSNRNNGSSAHPWATLAAAEGRIEPGAVVHVLPGVYTSSSEIKLTATGAPIARVVFVSDVPWGAKLVGKGGGNSTVVWITGDYVDFKGFDITGAGAMGVYVTGSNDRIIGNNIHDIPATGCKAGAGILNGNYKDGHDVDIISNVVHDVGDYSKPCALVHGIYSSNRGGHIVNNIVFRNQGWGIHTWHAAMQTTISNNTVFNNAYGGIIVGAGDGNWTNDNTVVSNNIVYRNGLVPGAKGNGIEEYGKTGTHNQYLNNLVFQNGPADWRLQNGNIHNGTITADPLFENYTGDASGDYRLKPNSPARNVKSATRARESGTLPEYLEHRIGADPEANASAIRQVQARH